LNFTSFSPATMRRGFSKCFRSPHRDLYIETYMRLNFLSCKQ
jgi:hypothetical protein